MRAAGMHASCTAVLLLCAGLAHSTSERQSDALAREILEQLVDIDTTESTGNVTTAAEAMAARLRVAGYADGDIELAGPEARKRNLLVRLRGDGRHPPVLLIGHLDVVEARREDWSTDPFRLVEKDGYLYGRGTQDMKGGDAIMVSTMIRLKREGFQPARDIILALTADEEGGAANGVQWLMQNRPELRQAQLVLNHDTNSVIAEHGRPQYFELDASEKLYADYLLTATSPGGHSSEPVPGNVIYEMAAALGRLAGYVFPFELNNVTRAYYQQMAQVESPERAADMRRIVGPSPDAAALARLARDPKDNSMLHTTCVATRLEAGHANNALPQRASATVNCRILPGHSPEEVRQRLVQVIADEHISVQALGADGALHAQAAAEHGLAPPPLAPQLMHPLQRVVSAMWPGLRIVPTMSAGATDAVFTSVAHLPTYAIGGLQVDRDDDRAHGRDERVGVDSFRRGNEFWYRLIKGVCAD